ncbi:MAG: hypothetical protein ABIO70_20160 [Pseudomonadota bacterium]
MPRLLAPLLLAACHATPPAALPVAGSTAALAGERVVEGTLASRVVRDDADLVIFYGGEQRGSMETCGCPKEPRGGLPRLAAYLEASVAANPDTPWILVGGGWFLDDVIGLDGQLRADVRVADRWMLRGLAAQGAWTALNVGFTDLPGLVDGAAEAPALPLVSANIRPRAEGVPPIADWIGVQAGAHRVGITGISAAGVGFLPAPEYAVAPPAPAAEAALAAHADGADVVVLLAFQAIDEARQIAERNPRIDVVIDAFHHSEVVPPFTVGGAVWVKSSHETMALGELRLWLDDGHVVRALDRKIDLDPDIPGQRAMVDIAVQAHQEIEAAERELWGP